jgi:hypothetical protein
VVSRTVVLLSCCLVAPVFAQEQPATDSLPFRPGQWAAHFILGSFTGVGASRFRSAARATVWQLGTVFSHRQQSQDDIGGGTTRTALTNASATIRIGWRRYRSGTSRVTPYATLGTLLTAAYMRAVSGGQDTWTTGLGAGVFGDVGALYRVTSNLALGAAGTVDLRVVHTFGRQASGLSTSAWDAQLSGITVSAGLTLLF